MKPHQRLTWPSLPQWRRRWLLAALMSAGWWGSMARAEAQTTARAAALMAGRGKRRAGGGMPDTFVHFVDHLIPADDLTPAASGLKVPQRVWSEALLEPEGQRLVSVVCQWLDSYGEGFARLSWDEREALVRWISTAPWSSPQRRFFHWVRERAFTHYYSQAPSWRGLPVQRPPQPVGHVLD